MDFPTLEACARQYQERFDRIYEENEKPFRPSRISRGHLAGIQEVIGEVLPEEFVRVVTTYDFSGLDIGQVIFGYGEEYEDFERCNSHDGMPWWLRGPKPQSLIMIGGTTAWTILMNVLDGSIHAFENPWEGDAERIALRFELFLRAACFLSVQDNVDVTDRFEQEFLEAIGHPASRFWAQVSRGGA
ncbi:MAG: hypothetical protein WBD40_12035 [Tepidisphaeraceae bacterium]